MLSLRILLGSSDLHRCRGRRTFGDVGKADSARGSEKSRPLLLVSGTRMARLERPRKLGSRFTPASDETTRIAEGDSSGSPIGCHSAGQGAAFWKARWRGSPIDCHGVLDRSPLFGQCFPYRQCFMRGELRGSQGGGLEHRSTRGFEHVKNREQNTIKPVVTYDHHSLGPP